ncbi:hypothetical protein LHFGNBLO_005072 [Mesorhizobium sp. AR10]|uniref:hypothetical protein n=1 Tax=Mesorhizobium sp. AR10 TaxID=2865839 RepID=UPI00215FFA34|nr:hypothetical protein [Mesorhizobium sp. AR10]UVK37958.1 hypothetical protein LHFGNBLO_005072 [Mesorhizobium sp. AR10]
MSETRNIDAQTLADRYVAVWHETDEHRRRDAIAALWVPDGQHYVGERAARGYEALEARIRGSHEKTSGMTATGSALSRMPGCCVTSSPFYWEMLPADSETVLATGLEILTVDAEGRILVDYQFVPARP